MSAEGWNLCADVHASHVLLKRAQRQRDAFDTSSSSSFANEGSAFIRPSVGKDTTALPSTAAIGTRAAACLQRLVDAMATPRSALDAADAMIAHVGHSVSSACTGPRLSPSAEQGVASLVALPDAVTALNAQLEDVVLTGDEGRTGARAPAAVPGDAVAQALLFSLARRCVAADGSDTDAVAAAAHLVPRLCQRGRLSTTVRAAVAAFAIVGARSRTGHGFVRPAVQKIWTLLLRPMSQRATTTRGRRELGGFLRRVLNDFTAVDEGLMEAVLGGAEERSRIPWPATALALNEWPNARVGLHVMVDELIQLSRSLHSSSKEEEAPGPVPSSAELRAVDACLSELLVTQVVSATNPRRSVDLLVFVARHRIVWKTSEQQGADDADELRAVDGVAKRSDEPARLGVILSLSVEQWAATGDRNARLRVPPTESSPGFDIASEFTQVASPEAQESLVNALMAVLESAKVKGDVDRYMATQPGSVESGDASIGDERSWLPELLRGVSLRLASTRPEVQRVGALVAVRFSMLMRETLKADGSAEAGSIDEDFSIEQFERQWPKVLETYREGTHNFADSLRAGGTASSSNNTAAMPIVAPAVGSVTVAASTSHRRVVRAPAWRYPDSDKPLDADAPVPLFAPAFVHDSYYGDVVERLGGKARWDDRLAHQRAPDGSQSSGVGGEGRRVAAAIEGGGSHSGSVKPLPRLGNVEDNALAARDETGGRIKPLRSLDAAVTVLAEGKADAHSEREAAVRALPTLLEADTEAALALRRQRATDDNAKLRSVSAGIQDLSVTVNEALALRRGDDVWMAAADSSGPPTSNTATADGSERVAALLGVLVGLIGNLTGTDVPAQRRAICRSMMLAFVRWPRAAVGWAAENLYSHRFSIAQRSAAMRALTDGCLALAAGTTRVPSDDGDADYSGASSPTKTPSSGAKAQQRKLRLYPPMAPASSTGAGGDRRIIATTTQAAGVDAASGSTGAAISHGTIRWRSVRLDLPSDDATAAARENLLLEHALPAVHALLAQHDTGHYRVMEDEVHMAAELTVSLHRILLAVRCHRLAVAAIAEPMVNFGALALAHPHPIVRQRVAGLLTAVFALWDDSIGGASGHGSPGSAHLGALAVSGLVGEASRWATAATAVGLSAQRALQLETSPDVLPVLERLVDGLGFAPAAY